MHAARIGAWFDCRKVQGHTYRQTLIEAGDDRHEHRPGAQACPARHLGHVLVPECQSIRSRRSQALRHRLRLVLLDHLAATARVAGDRRRAQRGVGIDQPGVDQWTNQQDECGGMATWIADAFALAQSITLTGRQLRQAEHPGRIDAMRRAGVDHAGARIGHPTGGLACGLVGQAQKRHVGRVEQARPFGVVLAQLGGDAQHFDVATPCQQVVDLQSGRAFLAINEYGVTHRAIFCEPRGGVDKDIVNRQRPAESAARDD